MPETVNLLSKDSADDRTKIYWSQSREWANLLLADWKGSESLLCSIVRGGMPHRCTFYCACFLWYFGGGGVLVLRKLFTGLGREGRAEVSGRRLIDLLLMNFRKAILKRDDQVNKKDKNWKILILGGACKGPIKMSVCDSEENRRKLAWLVPGYILVSIST